MLPALQFHVSHLTFCERQRSFISAKQASSLCSRLPELRQTPRSELPLIDHKLLIING